MDDGEEPDDHEEPWLRPSAEPGIWEFDNGIVIGDDVAERLLAPPEPPTQGALDAICGGATRVVVVDVRDLFELGPKHYRTSPELLADVRSEAVLAELGRALRIQEPGDSWRAGTSCDLVLEVFREREHRGSVAVYRDAEISWNRLRDQAALIDPETLLAWLDDRGATFIRETVEEIRAELLRWQAEADRWFAAMPACLQRHRDAMLANQVRFDWVGAEADLVLAYPDPPDAARALFEWFGSGSGPWSGFPAYETAPEWYLLTLPLDALLRAATSEPSNERLTEGAARFFGGWSFNTRRPDDRALLPSDVRRTLLEHVLSSDDDDKRRRALQAFG